MKSLLSAFIAFFANSASDAHSQTPTIDDIRKLPVGIRVTHAPNPVTATRNGRSGNEYTWKYRTSVSAIDKEITVIEFGCFVEHDAKWVFCNYTGKPFTGQDFAEWYSCNDARLKIGSFANDPDNWGGNLRLQSAKRLWYYIGIDSGGNRYRGEAIVEELDRLAN